MRTNWYLLSVHFWSSLIILSLSYSCIPRVSLEQSWRVWILGDLEQEGKERVGKCKQSLGSSATSGFDCRYRVACMFSSIVLEHLVYACGFSQHFHFFDIHGGVGLFHNFFLVVSHDSFNCWVDLLVLGALFVQMICSLMDSYWAKLLVLEPPLDKQYEALGGLSYQSWRPS